MTLSIYVGMTIQHYHILKHIILSNFIDLSSRHT